MAMKIDLDAVLADTPSVEWHGTEYKVADVPVSKMLELAQMAQEAEEDERVWLNLKQQVQALVPNAPKEFYEELGLRQTIVLINAITSDATDLGEERTARYIKRT